MCHVLQFIFLAKWSIWRLQIFMVLVESNFPEFSISQLEGGRFGTYGLLNSTTMCWFRSIGCSNNGVCWTWEYFVQWNCAIKGHTGKWDSTTKCAVICFCSRIFCTWFRSIQTYPETLSIDFECYICYPIIAFLVGSGVLSLVLYWSLILQVDPFEWELLNCDQLSFFLGSLQRCWVSAALGFEMWMECRR